MKFAFAEGERCLCFHGPLIYEAQILKTEWHSEGNPQFPERVGPYYRVHYKGWKKAWDEVVPEVRVLKLSEENLARQKQLNEAQKVRNAAERAANKAGSLGAGSTTGDKGRKEGGRGTKRGRESGVEQEEEYMSRPEVKIPIPEALKIQLVDDWEAVTKNNQLVTLPRDPNVVTLLQQYKTYSATSKTSPKSKPLTAEVIAGLIVYFDKALGHSLLYRSERQQWADIRKGKEDKPASDIYGAEHLLRLFVNLPGMIAHTTMDAESVAVLREHLGDILRRVMDDARAKEDISIPYDDASPAYQNLNRAM